MIKRVLFHVEHLNIMDIRPLELETTLRIEGIRNVLSQMKGDSNAITLIHDGRILACMGFFDVGPGVVAVWLIPSIHVEKATIPFVREVNRYLEVTAKVLGWHRAQTLTRIDSFHRRWMKALKFSEESVLKQYINKEDYILSVRFF